MRRPPPTPAQWTLDSELNGGHTVDETLAYLSDCADWADEQAARWQRPAEFISVDEPRSLLPGWLRRRARRAHG